MDLLTIDEMIERIKNCPSAYRVARGVLSEPSEFSRNAYEVYIKTVYYEFLADDVDLYDGTPIDKKSYVVMRLREPKGVDYYNFAIDFSDGKRGIEVNRHGDYKTGLATIKQRYKNIKKIYVGV